MPMTLRPGIVATRADSRGHVARDIVRELDYSARLDSARRFELVHGDDRSRADLDDIASDVEVLEHRFEQPRITFEPDPIDLLAAALGRGREQIQSRELVIVAKGEARLGGGLAGDAPRRGSDGSRRSGDRHRGTGFRRSGCRRPVIVDLSCARRCSALTRFASEPSGHGRLLAGRETEREIAEQQASQSEQQQNRQVRGAGDRRIMDKADGAIHAVGRAEPDCAAPTRGQPGNRRAAGQAERNSNEHGADCGDEQGPARFGLRARGAAF
jgi:hypothetical protein